MNWKTKLVVAGIIYQEDKILLVEQQGPNDPAPNSALPGGVVEPGENLISALTREISEESGLKLIELGDLVYTAHILNRAVQSQTLAMVFEVKQWSGDIAVNDPDGFVLWAAFQPRTLAILRLSQLPWKSMYEPPVAYLSGEMKAGAYWSYASSADEQETLLWRS